MSEVQGFRLSPRQRRLWSCGAGALVTRCVLEVNGTAAPSRLRAAAADVVARHEILRTVFRSVPGVKLPVQVVLEEPFFSWREEDLSVPDLLAGGGELDLANGPVARFVLSHQAPDRVFLAVELPALCADARSLMRIAAELAAVAGGEEPEEDAPVQYADVCDWLEELDQEEGEAGRDFWRARGGSGPLLVLPAEGGQKGAPEGAVLPRDWEISPATAQGVERMAARAGVSLEVMFLAAWQALLGRLSGGEAGAPAVGLVRDGRRFRQFRTALGPFATPVPTLAPWDPRMRLGELAHALQDFLEESRARVELFPAEELGPAGFPALFEMEEWPEDLRAGGLRLALAGRSEDGEPASLALRLIRRGESLTARLTADPALFAAERLERLAASLDALLADAVRRPDAPLGDLDVLGPRERRRLLVEWGSGPSEPVPAGCLHDLIAARAAAEPDTVAAGFGGTEISFGELDRRANRLARRLRRFDVGPEVRVALCAERSLESLLGILAIWKAGGAYVPLDPRQPAERLAFQLADCGAPVMLAQERLLSRLPIGEARALPLDVDLTEESDAPVASGVQADNLAYVIYTSGSTGRPKGAMVRHAALLHLALSLRRSVYAGIEGRLRVAVNAPLAFDASVKQLVQWAHGHSVHVVPEEVRADGDALLSHVRRHHLDVLDVTPGQLRLLLQAMPDAPAGEHPRLVLVGGEAVDGPLWEALAATTAGGGPVFQNVYGPTECTVDATSRRIETGVSPALGRPIPNVRVHVLDERGASAPTGVPGELVIAGAGVGRGYLGHPALTAERFVPDPFAGELGKTGERLYRSGDLARWRSDGELEFLGRIDHQVKIRGFRVELGEIEEALRRHPGVAAAVVVARDAGPGDLRLSGYAVPRRAVVDTGGRPRLRLPNGLAVVQQNRNETEYLYREIFEERAYLRHGLRLPAGARVFDVGANIGLFTLFAGLASPGARVWACEPIAPLLEAVRLNAALHGVDARPLGIGLAAAEGTARFSYYPRYSMLSGLSDYADAEGDARVIKDFLRHEASGALLDNADELLAGRFQAEIHECRLRRLSDVIREEGVDRIDLLKIDVQRAELDVLRGIDGEHWGLIDQLVVEVHDAPAGPTAGRLAEVRTLLEEQGFEVLTDQEESLRGTDRHTVYAARRKGGSPRLVYGLEPPPAPAPAVADLEEVTPAVLRDHLRTRLPEHMVPADLVLLPELPLTRNGKVDRAALPDPRTLAVDAPAEAPRGPVEEVLAAVWSSLLRVERVSPGDDFFQLGGHSLLVTQLVSRIRRSFGLELPIPAVFEAPTLRALAERIADASASALPLPAVEAGPVDEPAPLSFPQRRLWLIDRLEPGTPLYNNAFAMRFAGPLRPAALAAALAEIIRRHTILRSVFVDAFGESGEPVQMVRPAGSIPLPVIDLAGLPAALVASESERLQRAEAAAPFDLTRGPLLRASLLRTGPAEHTALLTLHHIVCDGWSLGVLARETGSLYTAAAAGRPSPLPELPVQYADYARWQRSWLTEEVLAERLAGWRSRLAGLASELPLPADRTRPAVPGHRGSRRPFRLPAAPAERLREIGREAGATPFMTLLAALQVLLARHAGVDDVAVGSPVAGRDRLEIEGLIGFFVNTLVLRGDLAGDPSFPVLLARVRDSVLFAHRNEVPFEVLVDALSPERRLGRSPLFRVLFVLRNEPREELLLPSLEATPLEVDPGISRLDLTVLVEETADGLSGFWEHAVELFDAATVDRLAGRWRVLLAGIAADPARPLSDLPLLDASEREQLLAWRGVPAGWDLAEATVPRRLARVAEEHPEAPAVLYHGETLTYRELFRRTRALAARLRELGVGRETEVGIYLPRSPEMVIAVLAVLEAGGTYVPLDPAYPAERLALLLEEARPAVLVTSARLPAGLAAAADTRLLRIEDEALALGEPSDSGGGGGSPLPESAAYRLYTSGSTGRPKGVVVTHRGLCNLLEAQTRAFAVHPGDRVLQVSSLGFDASISEILMALGVGAALVLADREEVLPGPGLAALLRDTGITHVTLPPSVLALLPEEELPALATLIVAGEACPPELAARWAAGRRFLNAYGPTETTVCATIETEYSGRGPLTIGRPMAGAEAHLLDAAFRPVPPGAPGELCVGGFGVARGYAGRPDLTAERFLPDPAGALGARLYRTGDLARHLPDGRLDYLGRIDRQVKVRGARIEPGEVEATLRRHTTVHDAVVAAWTDAAGDRRLVAWVVPVPGEEIVGTALRTWLRGSLPEALIPSDLIPVPALPLNPHGKLDLAALPPPGENLGATLGTAPRNPVEEALAGIWEEVLGLDRVGVEDDFFALGGHSLLAVRVIARLRAVFGIDLPLRTLFEAPTVADLARSVEASVRAGALPEAPPLTRTARGGRPPLSFAQQRLWFLDQLDPGSSRYNLPAAARLDGPLDNRATTALEKALSGVVRRHEALRTSFPADGGRPWQEIAPAGPVHLPVVDLSALPAPAGECELSRLAAEDAARPFDLAHGPVLRAALVRLGSNGGAVLLALHHIAGDGRSLEILLDEIGALAAGEPLPELPVQYIDYAAWQREWLTGEALEARLGFWRERLAGAPAVLELPTDRPRPDFPSSRGLQRLLGPAVTAVDLRATARREGVTPFQLALAAFQAFLGRITGQDDLCVGAPVAGRDHLETERLIGFFVNTLVLRADLAGDPTGREMLARTRAEVLAAHQHGDLPFEKLVDELRPGRDLRHEPLFQALFGFQRAAVPPAALAGLSVRPLEVEGTTAKLDLVLTLVERGDEVSGTLELRRDLFDAATADRLATGFQRLLAGLAADPGRRLSELPLLAAAESEQLLRWGRAEEPLASATVPELFTRQVVERPAAAAVLCGGEVLSFAELDRRSGILAHILRKAGVAAETRVALCVERSFDLVVGVLGILRAGGALVPLDPAQPPARLAWMLEDSGASLAVTQERLLPHLRPLSCPTVLLEESTQAGDGWSAPEVEAPPRSLAYLIYTSGTTGKPKAVLAEHRGLSRLLAAVRSTFGFGPGDRMPCLAPATFDIFLFELLAPLLAGGTVSLLPARPVLDPDLLARELEKATLLHAVPVLMRQVVDEARRRGASAPRLRGLFVGGDAVPSALLADLRATFPQAWIRVLYGPTEGTILASSHLVTEAEAPRPWLGRPLPGVELRVCDRRGVLVPAGSPGELWIGGPGVTRGYHGRPDLTAERWAPADEGGRFYRTGDLARWRADGELEFLGRADAQVKVRGVRIEPGEVEAALLRHPEVAAAAVAAREPFGGVGDRRLVAWIVPRASATPDSAELRSFLAESLPDTLIPSAFVALPALPLTVHGKVDRAALPDPGRERPELAAAEVAPGSRAERVLARIWAEVLGLDSVGVHDNFFLLGGDSILSIQIVARAHQAGLRLTPRQVFQHQTIAELASVAGAAVEDAEQGPVTGPVPLTPIQRRFFAASPVDPHHFNQALLLDVEPAAGVWLRPLLGRAAAALVEHHDALRLCFQRGSAGWTQEIVSPSGEPQGTVVDLSALPSAVRRIALSKVTAAFQEGFDLATGPLLRAALLDFGEGEEQEKGLRLWIGAHHLAVDGVSWRILLDDLRTAGEQLLQGGAVRLPARTTSFRSWGEALEALARSGERRRELDGWLTPAARRSAALLVPAGVPTGQVGEGRSLAADLDSEETRALLLDAPAALRAQVPELLLTALALALRRQAPAGVLWIDLEGHGREEVFSKVDLSRTVGWFTTIHPVALDPGNDGDLAAALSHVKEQVRAVPDRGFGFGVLRYLDESTAELLAGLPQPAVAFNYLGRVDAGASGPFRPAAESPGSARSPRAAREHHFELGAWVSGDRLRLEWSYHPTAQSAAAAEALVGSLLESLRRLLDLAREPRAVAPSAIDFPLLNLGGGELDDLLREVDFEGVGS